MDVQNYTRYNRKPAKIDLSHSNLYRTKTEVRKLRTAITMAEKYQDSSYVELQRIYLDVDDDSRVVKCTNHIMAAIAKLDNDYAKASPKITELFDGQWFKDYIKYAYESITFGHSLVQIGDIVDDMVTECTLIPRANVNPKEGVIYPSLNDRTGISLNDTRLKNWYVLLSNSKSRNYLGEYSRVATYQIALKDTQIALYSYIQRFGSPQVIVQTNKQSDEELMALENYLSDLAVNTYGIVGQEDKVNIVEPKTNDGSVYFTAIKEYKSNISDILLGQATVGEDQAYVGAVEVSERAIADKVMAVRKYIENTVNTKLIPSLINLGLTYLNGFTFQFTEEQVVDDDKQLKLIDILLKNNYEIDLNLIDDRYGIKVLGRAKTEPKKTAKPMQDDEEVEEEEMEVYK